MDEGPLLSPVAKHDEFDDDADFQGAAWMIELRQMAGIALPSTIQLIAQNGMTMADLAILGHYGTDELAAAAFASIWINITLALLYRGFGGATNVLCSQAYGAGNYELVGHWLQLSLAVTTVCVLPLAGTWLFLDRMVLAIGGDAHTASLAGSFARISAAWMWPEAIMAVWANYFQAQKIVYPFMAVSAAFLGLNCVLNYLLVFQTSLGFIGSPIATTITKWLQLGTLVVYIVKIKKLHSKTWHGWTMEALQRPGRLRTWLEQCIPMMLAGLLEDLQVSTALTVLHSISSLFLRTFHSSIHTHNKLYTTHYALHTTIRSA
jgi:MATE family multidrug resistance protein